MIFYNDFDFYAVDLPTYVAFSIWMILFWILILAMPHIYFGKGGLLFFEKELSSKFNIMDKKSLKIKRGKKATEGIEMPKYIIIGPHNDLHNVRWFKYEYLKICYENFPTCIGVIEKKKYIHVRNGRRWIAESDIFFDFEVPYKFKYVTSVGFPRNLSEIDDIEAFKSAIIVPKYNNISTIFYENKEYTQKILSETVQKKISDLNIEIKNVGLYFKDNRIIVIIPNSRWSTLFSKIFCPERNAEKIVKVIETVLVSLKDISDEIERSEEY